MHAGKLTNLPYSFVKDGKAKAPNTGKDWTAPYGDGGWPRATAAAAHEEKEWPSSAGWSLESCDIAEVDGAYVAAHPELYDFSFNYNCLESRVFDIFSCFFFFLF